MGNFRIEIDGIGGHGCQREIKDGGKVEGCGRPFCPDCIARKFVAELRAAGVFTMNCPAPDGVTCPRAIFTHWPGAEGSVQDDLLTGIRKGSF